MAANLSEGQDRLVMNGVYSAASWFVPLLIAFVATPLMVRGLGNEEFGLYSLILGFVGYSFTFGIGRIAGKYVAEYRASGEPEKAAQAVSATLWLSLIAAALGVIAILIAARSIVTVVLNIPPDHEQAAVMSLYIAAAAIVAVMISQVFQCTLQGVHRFDRYLLLLNLYGVILNVGSVALVLLGRGVVPLLIWFLVSNCIIGLLNYLSARKFVKEFTFRVSIDRRIWSAVFRYGGNIILHQIFGNLLLIFERSWITRHFGAEELTFYVVPMTLGLYLHGFISSLVLVLFPVVNEVLDDRERLSTIYKRATKIVTSLLILAVVSTVVGGQAFLTRWVGPDFAARAHWLLIIHVLTFALLANSTIVWQITEGFHRAGINALIAFLWFAISAPLMVVWSGNMGSEGVALARLIGVLVTLPMIYYVERRFLTISQFSFWAVNLLKLAVAAAGAGIIEWLIFTNFPVSWPILLAGFLSGGLIYMGLLLVLEYFNRGERERITGLVFRRQSI